jgi:hypothetical protein
METHLGVEQGSHGEQLRLNESLPSNRCSVGSPVESCEGGTYLARCGMSLCGESKPFGVGQIGTDPLPLGEAIMKLRNTFRMLPQAREGDTPCHGARRKPLSEAVLASDCDRCLCSRPRHTKLTGAKGAQPP